MAAQYADADHAAAYRAAASSPEREPSYETTDVVDQDDEEEDASAERDEVKTLGDGFTIVEVPQIHRAELDRTQALTTANPQAYG